jgi:hypothetical protein
MFYKLLEKNTFFKKFFSKCIYVRNRENKRESNNEKNNKIKIKLLIQIIIK